jgi:hypothetical protein
MIAVAFVGSCHNEPFPHGFALNGDLVHSERMKHQNDEVHPILNVNEGQLGHSFGL